MISSPILVLAYNRDRILDKTLSRLAGCDSIKSYPVFVHLDAPNIFLDEDVISNERVKCVIDKYRPCFGEYHFKEEKYHCGLAQSVINSVNEIIDKYGRIIVIEDDLLLSRDSIVFLENALHYYEDNKRIWSVTANTPKLKSVEGKSNNNSNSVFLSYRGSSLAWGTWKDRWDLVDWDVSDYPDFLENYELRQQFSRCGYDMPNMLMKQMEGFLDSWAIRWCYSQSKHNMMTVYPIHNRAYHIGFESATHAYDIFPQTELLDEYPDYEFDEYIDETINIEYRSHYGFDENTWDLSFENSQANSKFESMFNAMHLWKVINESGHDISEYFLHRDYRKIAIYGKGKIGIHVEKEVKKAGIDVLYYIDRNRSLCDGKDCLYPSDTLPDCDCIVVSVTVMAQELVSFLKKMTDCRIITIFDVLRDR